MSPIPELKELEFKVGERDFYTAGRITSEIKTNLQSLGLDQEIIKRVLIIIYEAVMNVVIHARFGTIKVFITPQKIMVIVEDIGKGIRNIDLAMQEGYTTAPRDIQEIGFGAGMGLPNIQRSADKLRIRSRIEVGVELKAVVYIRKKEREKRGEKNGSCGGC